jgi:myosin-5
MLYYHHHNHHHHYCVLLIFAEQLEASQLELDRRREECIQLHSVLANQTKGLKSVANNNYSSHVDIINEDGELVLAFEAQKKINR